MRRLLKRRVADDLDTQAALTVRALTADVNAGLAARPLTTAVDAALAVRALAADVEAQQERQARIEDARWALENTYWPDGREVTPTEKSAALHTLQMDRITRARKQ